MNFDKLEMPSSDITLEGLTKDQDEAFGEMSQMHSIFKLMGYAGTGKTFLINKFINSMSKRVVVTAPTHKAVGVANGDSTIHSYLSLKIKYKQDKQFLSQMPFLDNVRFGDVVVIDEASTISVELLHYILKAAEEYNLKIIFIGDPAQIPPVGERISPVWEVNSPNYILTDIVRQARDSNIISLATSIREGTAYTNGISRFVNNKEVFLGGIKELRDFYIMCMDEGDFPQIISHKNKVVDSSNIWARNIVQSNPNEDLLVGEEVYIRTAGEDQIHKLEDIVEIAFISEPYKFAFKNLEYPMMVKRILVRSYRGEEDLIIPASEKDVGLVQKNKSAFADKAKSRSSSWGVFWKFSNSISVIKHIYALTAHRAQGSTYENVAVNCNDLMKSKELMYTACTRASKKLFLYKQ